MIPEQLAGDSEHSQQVALFAWAALNFRNDARLRLLFAIPNGGERNKIVASRMKAEGVRAGVPDLLLPVPGYEVPGDDTPKWYGLFIEMKKPAARLKREAKHKWDTGGVSDEQVIWLNALEAQGYKVAVCYSWYEAANEIKFYLTGKGLGE
jgi:hypothetical protein